jgi:hypothetical protein
LIDRRGESVHTTARAADVLPARQETAQRGSGHGLDLLAQRGQATPAQQPQHFGVAPFHVAAVGVGREFARHHATAGRQSSQRVIDDGDAEAERRYVSVVVDRPRRQGVCSAFEGGTVP